MQRSRFIKSYALAFLTVALAPAWGLAQTTMSSGGTTTTTSSAATSTTASSSGATQTTGGSSGNLSNQSLVNPNQNTAQVTAIAIRSMTSGAGSATATPSNTNPFVQTYIDPMSVGLPSKYATSMGLAKPTGTFGKPLYTSTTKATTATASTATQTNVGFNTHGNVRAPAYTTILTNDVPFVAHTSGELLNKVQGTIDRSTWVPSKGNIQVTMNGTTVQLQGQVATDKERRVVEGMVRMTPGVSDVVNQLTVRDATK